MSKIDLSKLRNVEEIQSHKSWSVENYTILQETYATLRNYPAFKVIYTIYNGEVSIYTIRTQGLKPIAAFSTLKEAKAHVCELNNNTKPLGDLVKEVITLNDKMHNRLVEFLKEHNGLVRTDNAERRDKELPLCDRIYTISMDGDDEPNTEKEVLAVALIGEDQVAVLPNLGDETISGMTDQEVLDCDNWEWIYGGYTLQNATLTSICECIEEYV